MNIDNCLIWNDPKANNNLCYVFCSSNGLFWGKRTKEFVLENNWFEWMNIANNSMIKSAKKIIFLRDFEVSFYINGINEDIDSVSKILDFIKSETKGMSIIAVGYSAGGYLANIIGLFLDNVERVYGFGTVYNVRDWLSEYCDNRYLDVNLPSIKEKYLDLIPFFKNKDKKTTFYYVYGSKNEKDKKIASNVRTELNGSSIIYLPIASATHGVKLNYYVVIGLISGQKMLRSRNIPYTKIGFAIKINGLIKSIYYYLLELKYKKRLNDGK